MTVDKLTIQNDQKNWYADKTQNDCKQNDSIQNNCTQKNRIPVVYTLNDQTEVVYTK